MRNPYRWLRLKLWRLVTDRQRFLVLMKFPPEWDAWGLYPDELAASQMACYCPGDERASEHFRYGAFHWWVKNNPSREQLEKLVRLTFLDPDYLMADDARRYFVHCESFDREHERIIQGLDELRGAKEPFSWP